MGDPSTPIHTPKALAYCWVFLWRMQFGAYSGAFKCGQHHKALHLFDLIKNPLSDRVLHSILGIAIVFFSLFIGFFQQNTLHKAKNNTKQTNKKQYMRINRYIKNLQKEQLHRNSEPSCFKTTLLAHKINNLKNNNNINNNTQRKQNYTKNPQNISQD